MFGVGCTYTREAIHAQVGGSLQSFLPQLATALSPPACGSI